MKCFFFHNWSKWEKYFWEGEIKCIGLLYPKEIRGKWEEVTEYRQKRTCSNCGKYQEEAIND